MAAAKPRTTDGGTLTWCGAALLAFAVLLGIFAWAEAPGAAVLASSFALCGASCLFVGFWKRLFHNIELRLIDIQATLVVGEAPEAASEEVGSSS